MHVYEAANCKSIPFFPRFWDIIKFLCSVKITNHFIQIAELILPEPNSDVA